MITDEQAEANGDAMCELLVTVKIWLDWLARNARSQDSLFISNEASKLAERIYNTIGHLVPLGPHDVS